MQVMRSMELDDEDKLEAVLPMPMQTPDYPCGLRISLTEKELDKLELDHKDAVVGGTVHLFAMARITSVSENEVDGGNRTCRVELQIEELGIESEDAENETAEKQE